MTIAAGKKMHAERGRRPDLVTPEKVGTSGLARGSAMFRAAHSKDTGRRTAARAALVAAAEFAAAGGES